MKWLGKKTPTLTLASLYILAAPLVFFADTAGAAKLLTRSLEIGDSNPSANTFHEFNFTIATADSLGSIEFEYCVNNPFVDAPCTAPNGLDLTSATIASQSGVTGFTIDGLSTANKIVLSRASAPNLAFQAVSYRFNNVINPSDDSTVYVRISTYSTEDATGPYIDEGSVVFAITPGVSVEGYVPPYLTFCTGLTVSLDCTNTTGDFINLGELSKTSANFGSSQYSGATNDPGGFTTSVAGSTMTAGNKIIPALENPAPNRPGTSQFGINLRDNSSPNIGSNRSGPGTSTVMAGYNTPNLFKFVPNQVISRSLVSTDFNRFTVSYLVNASPSQPPGIYAATLTYIAVAAF